MNDKTTPATEEKPPVVNPESETFSEAESESGSIYKQPDEMNKPGSLQGGR